MSIQFFLKNKLEVSSFFNLEQLNTNNNKLNIINITNNDNSFIKTWY